MGFEIAAYGTRPADGLSVLKSIYEHTHVGIFRLRRHNGQYRIFGRIIFSDKRNDCQCHE